MQENWYAKFDLSLVARAANLSKCHFASIYRRYTGETPLTYHRRIKIQKIQEKLADPNISVTRAFHECGMEYKSEYVKLFTKTVGMTPSKYRKQILIDSQSNSTDTRRNIHA